MWRSRGDAPLPNFFLTPCLDSRAKMSLIYLKIVLIFFEVGSGTASDTALGKVRIIGINQIWPSPKKRFATPRRRPHGGPIEK